ncbi:MAG TPA: M18 family aminopeptidase [Acidimicrobiales bacterium]|nr:M18 family aminopeptidase [Acidimicrobiales bacterium]
MADLDTERLTDLRAFLDASPSPFHAVAEAAGRLEAAGFVAVDETAADAAAVERGYVARDGSIVAWAGLGGDLPVRMIGAHTDSPNLRVKPRPDLGRDGYRQLALEPYGGLLLNSWLGRDLGLAGRIALRDASIVPIRSAGAVLHLPQLAIHLDREVSSKGLLVDPQRHTPAVFGTGVAAAGDFAAWLASEAGVAPGDVVAWDVMTFDTTPAGLVGADDEFLASGRLDNLCSSWAALGAMLGAGRGLVALWDHEEIGSATNRGAGSPLVDAVLERLYPDPVARRRAVARGVCASSDMAHATHPNYPERHEPGHTITPGGGPVIKTNVNQRYATDARSAQVFVAACEAAGVPYQWYAHRADIPCGSTIGPITAARLGMSVVDVGAPMLAMHSARELMAAADAPLLERSLTAFLRG